AAHGAGTDAALRRQGPGQRSLGSRELHPQSSGPGQARGEAVSAVATVNRAELVQKEREAPAGRFRAIGAVLALAGGAVLVGGLLTGNAARVWHAYHFNFMFWTALAQALVVFAATQKLARAHWAGVLIRFAEAGSAFLVVSLVLYLGLILGRAYLFTGLPVDRPGVGFWFKGGFL